MSRINELKTVGRVVFLLFLLATTLGPWFADSHPATEETCSPPLVWLGGGYCACLITFVTDIGYSISSENAVWLLFMPPALPALSTLLLILIGERWWLWVSHLIAWGLVAIYALLWFFGIWYAHRGVLILWGAGLGGGVAVTVLVGELLIARPQFSMNHREELS